MRCDLKYSFVCFEIKNQKYIFIDSFLVTMSIKNVFLYKEGAPLRHHSWPLNSHLRSQWAITIFTPSIWSRDSWKSRTHSDQLVNFHPIIWPYSDVRSGYHSKNVWRHDNLILKDNGNTRRSSVVQPICV